MCRFPLENSRFADPFLRSRQSAMYITAIKSCKRVPADIHPSNVIAATFWRGRMRAFAGTGRRRERFYFDEWEARKNDTLQSAHKKEVMTTPASKKRDFHQVCAINRE